MLSLTEKESPVIDLSYWYDRKITIRLPDEASTFRTKIMWVHDLPPKEVWIDDVRFDAHISPELKDISDVFIWGRLPDRFRSTFCSCIFLNVVSGEWHYRSGDSRIRIIVEVDPAPT